MKLYQPFTSIGIFVMSLVTVNFIIYGVESIPTEFTSYLRFARNTGGGIMPMPPPVCPPPPRVASPQTCNKDCGSLKTLNTDSCQCECTMIIPAECPTPSHNHSHSHSHSHKHKKGKRSHSGGSQVSGGCRELTKKGRHYKKERGRRSHSKKTKKTKKSGSKGQTTQVTPSLNECPMGQQLNTTTCQCMIVM